MPRNLYLSSETKVELAWLIEAERRAWCRNERWDHRHALTASRNPLRLTFHAVPQKQLTECPAFLVACWSSKRRLCLTRCYLLGLEHPRAQPICRSQRGWPRSQSPESPWKRTREPALTWRYEQILVTSQMYLLVSHWP